MTRGIVYFCLTVSFGLSAAALPWPAEDEKKPHEYAEIRPYKSTHPEFRLKTVQGDREISLREYAKGYRLLLVSYIAPWCENSLYDAPLIAKLHEKYSDKGLEIISVSNYAPADELLKFVDRFNFLHTVVLDTTIKDDSNRLNSQHYQIRQALNDTRKWGTPLNIFIVDGQWDTPQIAIGELMEDNAVSFIESTLGLRKK